MYCHQVKNEVFPSRTAFPQERHLFLQGDVPGDSGLVLSTDAKPRLKWTMELHERFIEAVNQLGGADKATPKTVMRLMGIPGLTLYHLKSHLQKYRLSKNIQAQSNIVTTDGERVVANRMSGVSGSLIDDTNVSFRTNKTMQINEAILMQIEVQRQLNEQLEVQRHLEVRIEAQGKHLQSVLEKAQEALGKKNVDYAGMEASRVQLQELVSKVSNEYLTASLSKIKEIPSPPLVQAHKAHLVDCWMDSCLTSSEDYQMEQDVSMGMRSHHGISALHPKQNGIDLRLEKSQFVGCKDLHECKMLPSPISKELERKGFLVERDSNIRQMSVRVERVIDDNNSITKARQKGPYLEDPISKRLAGEGEKGKQLHGGVGRPLDLNAQDENDERFIF